MKAKNLKKFLAELNAESDDEKVLSALDIDPKNGRIGREQYDKRRAEILEEPYVNVIHMDVC